MTRGMLKSQRWKKMKIQYTKTYGKQKVQCLTWKFIAKNTSINKKKHLKLITTSQFIILETKEQNKTQSYRRIIGFLDGVSDKEPACQFRRHKRLRLNHWVEKIPWRRAQQPIPVFLPEKSHRQKSRAGYSPQGCKQSDTTEAAQQASKHGRIEII